MSATHSIFTRAGILQGARSTLPAFPGLIVFGMAFGTAAAQKGLSFGETLGLSAAVYDGAAQMVGLKVWHTDPRSQQEVVDYDNQVRPTEGEAGGPSIASAAPVRFHPAGSRVVDGGLVFH